MDVQCGDRAAHLGDLEQLLVVEDGLALLIGAHKLGEHHGGEVADRHLRMYVRWWWWLWWFGPGVTM